MRLTSVAALKEMLSQFRGGGCRQSEPSIRRRGWSFDFDFSEDDDAPVDQDHDAMDDA